MYVDFGRVFRSVVVVAVVVAVGAVVFTAAAPALAHK